MRVRSWLIRGLILAGVAALVALAWFANSWISPERVREQVVATLSEQFEGVDVHVGSARMRILGGIAVSDIRLTRRGDPPNQPFLTVPNAIVYHDKEQLNHGRLVIRKVEMDGPTFSVERSADGKWSLTEVMRRGTADRPIPTFVVKNGTVSVADKAPGALPAATFTDVQCTLLNDPLPTLTVQASGHAKGYGPVEIRGRLNRINGHLSASVELAAFPLGEAAVPAAKKVAPELVPHLARLAATASVKAELTYAPDASPQWRHDIRLSVKDARFEHKELPWPVEKIAATVRSVDGRIKVEEATAQIGQAKVRLSLETRNDTASAVPDGASAVPAVADDPLRKIEDNLQKLEVTAAGVALDDNLFKHLPEKMRRGRQMFSPTGQVDLGYKFTREGAGWRRELEVRPKQVAMVYEKFRYPVSDVRGVVKRTTTHNGGESSVIDLVGTVAGQFVTIIGRVEGSGDDPGVSLSITGLNLPIDDQLYAAFPPKYAAVVREFHASGRGDFTVKVTQQPGVNLIENEFRIDIKDGKLNYTAFPYPLEKLKGRLIVRTTSTDPARPLRPGEPPDRDEMMFDGFTAVHAGATLWMHGSKRLAPNGRDRKLVMHIGGKEVPLDAELKAALATAKVDGLWGTLSPRGAVSFTADVEVMDRAPAPGPRVPRPDPPLDPANDIKLTLDFRGPTVTPSFFPYELTELSGWLEYKNNRLDLSRLAGRHGSSRVKVGAGEVRFYPDGTVWANLGGVEMKPLIPDESLRKALPGRLGPALDELQLKGGADLLVKHMVVLAPPEKRGVSTESGGHRGPAVRSTGVDQTPARLAPVVYWDAELKLYGASLDTGVPWEDAYGALACRGRYEGTHFGALRGNVWLERAVVSRMPLTSAKCLLKAEAQQPDPARPGQYLPTTLQFLNATGNLFNGTLGGQARVVLTDPTRYEVWLTVTDAQLEEVARHYKLGSDADLKGVAQAQLLIFNKPDPRTGRLNVEGSGKIDVPTGRMYNLPILLELVKVLKLQTPDKTAFEQAHAVFRVQGDRIKVDQLDLIGNAVCVGGSGELDSSGDYVKFEFYTVWSKALREVVAVGDLTAFLSKNLFTIKLVRENGDLKYKPEPVPLVTEPAKAVFERLKRGANRFKGK